MREPKTYVPRLRDFARCVSDTCYYSANRSSISLLGTYSVSIMCWHESPDEEKSYWIILSTYFRSTRQIICLLMHRFFVWPGQAISRPGIGYAGKRIKLTIRGIAIIRMNYQDMVCLQRFTRLIVFNDAFECATAPLESCQRTFSFEFLPINISPIAIPHGMTTHNSRRVNYLIGAIMLWGDYSLL